MSEQTKSPFQKFKELDTSSASKFILAIVVIAFAVVYGAAWLKALAFPRALEYEGTMLWAAQTLAAGQNIYDPTKLSQAPWAVITYPPLFLACAALLIKAIGPTFAALRVITIVSALVSTIFLYKLLRRSGCSPVCSAIAPAYFMGYSPPFLWSVIGRPDMLAVALSIVGFERLYTASTVEPTDKKNWLIPCVVAGVMFALACFAKQTSVVCLVSGALFLLWCKQLKHLLALLGSFAATFTPLVVATQLITGGFIQNITIFGKTPWDSEMLWRYIHFMNDGDSILIEISFVVLLYCFVFKKQSTTVPERIPYILFALSLAQMMYIMGLPGSNGNHAIFTLMALSWWIALKASTLRLPTAQAILLGSLSALPGLFIIVPSTIASLPAEPVSLDGTALADKLVLSEDPYNNFLSHSKPAMIDCAVFTSVWKNQPDKLSQIAQAVERQDFAAVIINCRDSEGKEKQFWPDSILTAVRQHYRSAGKTSGNGLCQVLWLPKSEPNREKIDPK